MELRQKTEEKELYLKHLLDKNPRLLEEYKSQTKSLVKKQAGRNRYMSSIGSDVHGQQNTAHKIIKNLNKDEKDAANYNLFKNGGSDECLHEVL